MKPKQKIKRVRRILPNTNREILSPRTGPNSKYDDIRFPTIALSVLRNTGCDNTILGDILGVGPSTIKTWCRKHERFGEAVRRGKDEYDTEKVEKRLLQKALGYKYENKTYERELVGWVKDEFGNFKLDDDTGKKIPLFELVLTKVEQKEQAPDNTAIIFWLKNRNKDRWMDVNRIEKTVQYPDGPPVHNHIEQTLNMFLSTATEDQLKAIEALANQQPLIEASSGTSVSHG